MWVDASERILFSIVLGITLTLSVSFATIAAANSPNNLALLGSMTQARGVGLLLRIEDEARLQDILVELESTNKITVNQASRIQTA